MKTKIEQIRNLINEQVEANTAFREECDKISYDSRYEPEYKKELVKELDGKHLVEAVVRKDKILTAIDELYDMEQITIDLTDSRVSNAISLISASGSEISDDIKKDIENQFRGNQAALAAIKGAYQKASIDTHSIDNLMYDVTATYKALKQGIADDFKEPQHIGPLNSAFATLNHIESVCEPLPIVKPEIKTSPVPTMF